MMSCPIDHAPCRMTKIALWIGVTMATLLCALPTTAADSSTWHDQIDATILASHVGPVAGISADADFVRRAFLDLIGRIPTGNETQQFLNDTAEDKRTRLIERLLSDDQCNEHLATVLDVMLMERRADKRITTDEWRRFLRESLASSKPLDQLAREILAADGVDPATRPAAKFLLDRDVETHSLTRDVSRMFFGRDVQCAQCHDHPSVSDYRQAEYYGIAAFVHRSVLFEDEKDNKKGYVGERAEGDLSFKSVFDPDAQLSQGFPQTIDGLGLDREPQPDPDTAYQVKPDKNVRPVPAFSRRQQLAQLAVRGDAFRRNMVNRLWAHMFGRGLVEPVDFHHASNPPAHPRLLRLLADKLAEMNYDIKGFLKQIALSQTYQRAIELPSVEPKDWESAEKLLPDLERQLEFQNLVCQRTNADVEILSNRLAEARDALNGVRGEIQNALNSIQQTTTKLHEAQAELTKITEQRDNARALAEQLSAAAQGALGAVAKRPDDAELTQAANTLRTRADSLSAEVNQFDALAKEKQSAIDTLNTAITQQREAIAGRTAKRDELSVQCTERRGGYRAIVLQRDQEAELADELRLKIAACRQLIDYRDRLAEHHSAIKQVEVLEAQTTEMTQLESARRHVEETRVRVEAISQELAATWTRRFIGSAIRPLSPEQLAASTMVALGMDAQFRQASEDEWKAQLKDKAPDQVEPEQRRREIEQLVRKRYQPIVSQYIGLFAAPPASPQDTFTATVDQALYFANDGGFRGWLGPAAGNLTDRLRSVNDVRSAAEDMYLSVLSRRPTEDELAETCRLLAMPDANRAAVVQDLCWSLLTSTEFRFNH
jgi:hypothetical protein